MSLLKNRFISALLQVSIIVTVIWRLFYMLSGPSFAIALSSLLWLLYRVHRVLRQPVEELINVLGIEVPSAPLVSLLDVSEDTISIRWQASEKFSHTKYSVLVNGVSVGEITPQDNAISVTGLAGNLYYTVRVQASTHGKFNAESAPIRVRTTPRDHEDEQEEVDVRSAQSTAPAVIPYKGQYDGTALTAPPLVREHSGSLSQPRRRVSLRKSSPTPYVAQGDRRVSDQRKDDESSETVKTLTAKLDELRREAAEQQKQDEEEEEQHKAELQALTERRDELKREAKEKEDQSKDLRKNVAALEGQNLAAQRKRTTQEKALEAKQSERQKIQEDIQRWDAEVLQFKNNMDAMREERERLGKSLEDELDQIRIEREPEMETMRKLEEQIRDVGKQVKELEENRRENSDPSASPKVAESELHVDDVAKGRNDRISQMQDELRQKILEVQQTKQYLMQLNAKLSAPAPQQRSQNPYDPQAPEFTPSNHPVTMAQPREPERRASLSGFPGFPTGVTTEPSNPFPTRLHPNLNSGGLAPIDARDEGTLRGPPSQADIDRLTGGALASPSANALLPKGLLVDEREEPEDMFSRHRARRSGHESDSLGSRPPSTAPPPGVEYHQALRETSRGTTNFLPGLGELPGLGSSAALHQAGPHSPVAGESRSPSLTSSPHESLYHRPSDTLLDSDGRSIRSTSSSSRAFAPPRTSRFAFSRQRGKSTTEDGPTLGSLRSSESQSFPRKSDGETGEGAAMPGQHRMTGGLLSKFGRRNMGSRLGASTDETGREQASSNTDLNRLRSGHFPFSNSSLDFSSRPNSVYSAENAFPRPTAENAFMLGWNESGLGRSNTSASATRRLHAMSLGASRRGSAQVDPMGLSDIEPADEDVLPLSDRNASPIQAPIGTKPSKFKKKDTAKEPVSSKDQSSAAGSFMSNMFSRDKKADRRKDKSPSRPETSDAPTDDLGISGTPHPREASVHSITGATDDVRASSPRASESGPSTPADATPTTRKSLMSKLSRKSSHIPGFKGRKVTGSNTPQSNVEDTDDGEAMGGVIARTPSSMTSSPKVSHEKDKDRDKDGPSKRSSGLSLNSFHLRRPKKDKDAPSISETSMTSGTGDEAERSERPSTDD